eukprot:8678259-Pyramimonas_sp.AAC.1
MVVANTFLDRPVVEKVTYYDLGTDPTSEITCKKFAEIDHLIIDERWQHVVRSVKSDRSLAFASHHFLVQATLDVDIPKSGPTGRSPRLDPASLQRPSVAEQFVGSFVEAAAAGPAPPGVDDHAQHVVRCLESAAEQCLDGRQAQAKRPWIRRGTLDLIELRNQARTSRQFTLEQELSRQVRQSARKDRAA